MAFNIGDRVRVSNQQSQFRTNQLGTVIDVPDAGKYMVRPDGYPNGVGVLMLEAELVTTTQPCALTY